MTNPQSRFGEEFQMNGTDIRAQVTEKIIALLEKGVLPWRKEWAANAHSQANGMPFNFASKNRYHGINVVILWAEAFLREFPTHQWATFQQIKNAGGHVRKGEKGTQVVFYKSLDIAEVNEEGAEEDKKIPLMRTFTVFNIAQCEGFSPPEPMVLEDDTVTEKMKIDQAEAFVKNTSAQIYFGGIRACYMPGFDRIMMPELQSFTTTEAYYATTLHELTHWTGHETRLNRQLSKKFGDLNYAAEELIAELGSAFLCAELDINSNLENHASYVESWLKVLKADKKAIFIASAAAAKAADYLNSLQSTDCKISIAST